jgi:meiosis induction protein kinase IME2/SME1
MTVGHEHPHRTSSLAGAVASSVLEDRFELIKEIGDGSFGSVSLARVRGAGAQIARRGTMVRRRVGRVGPHANRVPRSPSRR